MSADPAAQSYPFRVAALYRFARVDDPDALRSELAAFCCARKIRGTLLVASEGINGTVAGTAEAIEALVAHLRGNSAFADLDVKYGTSEQQPFRRLKVKVKAEIVSMGVPGIDPRFSAGTYVEPAAWNALLADPGTVLIDTRNDYEVSLGTFPGALDPGTRSFREFPAWVDANRESLEGRTVAMFCTGGIRCEKATAYLRQAGLQHVLHLKGGILRYLEEVPAEESVWAGECFVFDERVSVGVGLVAGEASLCRACRRPLAATDKTTPAFQEGVSCPHCLDEHSPADRERFAERQRQVELARARGGNPHLSE